MMKQQKGKRLTTLFNEFNRIFFDDRLPRYRIKRVNFDTNQRGECLPEKRTILIHRGLTGNELRQALLHEMCHIGSVRHGKRFQAKLIRLASLGEKWAEGERAGYEEAIINSPPITANIRHIIQDWAWQCADIPWIKIRRMLAREVGLPPSRLVKVAPWARQVWQREVVEWRADERMREINRAKISQATSLPRDQ